jgi:hypothetical protein
MEIKSLTFSRCFLFRTYTRPQYTVHSRSDNFSPRMPCQMGFRWNVRWQARILIGQSCSPLPIGMVFERLKLSPQISHGQGLNSTQNIIFAHTASSWTKHTASVYGRCSDKKAIHQKFFQQCTHTVL